MCGSGASSSSSCSAPWILTALMPAPPARPGSRRGRWRSSGRRPTAARTAWRGTHPGRTQLLIGAAAVADLEDEHDLEPRAVLGGRHLHPGAVLGRMTLLGEREAGAAEGERRVGGIVVARLGLEPEPIAIPGDRPLDVGDGED